MVLLCIVRRELIQAKVYLKQIRSLHDKIAPVLLEQKITLLKKNSLKSKPVNLNRTFFSRFHTHTLKARLLSITVHDLMDDFEKGQDELD